MKKTALALFLTTLATSAFAADFAQEHTLTINGALLIWQKLLPACWATPKALRQNWWTTSQTAWAQKKSRAIK